MADDLDAFFDEVSAAEAEAVEKEEDKVAAPPVKKAKTEHRPVGVVVAAAASSSTTTNKPEETKEFASITIEPPPLSTTTASIQPPLPPGSPPSEKDAQKKKSQIYRCAAGTRWVDPTLTEWPENDYRLFVGNLSKEVTEEQLYQHFIKYPSLQMVKIVCDKNGISKEFGFVSLLNPLEMARAIREMDQSWLGSRPIRVKKSDWKDRDLKNVKKKQRKKKF